MDLRILSELKSLYEIYTTEFKPLLAFVESFKGKFPGPILNEIRALNDHVSRCFITEKSTEDALQEIAKAKGHLSRACLDCFKALLIAYEQQIMEFKHLYREINLAIVKDGQFLPKLMELHRKAQEQAVVARKKESMAFPDKEEAYQEYKKAVIAYDTVIQYIRECSSALANARMYARNDAKKQLRENWKFAIISAIVGVILGYILNLCLY